MGLADHPDAIEAEFFCYAGGFSWVVLYGRSQCYHWRLFFRCNSVVFKEVFSSSEAGRLGGGSTDILGNLGASFSHVLRVAKMVANGLAKDLVSRSSMYFNVQSLCFHLGYFGFLVLCAGIFFYIFLLFWINKIYCYKKKHS